MDSDTDTNCQSRQNETSLESPSSLVINDDVLERIHDCLEIDNVDELKRILDWRRDHFNKGQLLFDDVVVEAFEAIINADRMDWLWGIIQADFECTFLNHFVLALLKCRHLIFLHNFPMINLVHKFLDFSVLQRLLNIALEDVDPEDYLGCLDELISDHRNYGRIALFPPRDEPFKISTHKLIEWTDIFGTQKLYHAAVYILLLVHDFDSICKLLECLRDDIPLCQLFSLIFLCTKADEFWNTNHLKERLRNLNRRSKTEYTYWRLYFMKHYIALRDYSPKLADFVLDLIPYNRLWSLLVSPDQRSLALLITQCSQKAGMLGHLLFRAITLQEIDFLQEYLDDYRQFIFKGLCNNIDLSFLGPLFRDPPVLSDQKSIDNYHKTMTIHLIRSGLLHQYRHWLINTRLPECRRIRHHTCQYCNVQSYLHLHSQHNNEDALALLLMSGFLPSSLQWQLRPFASLYQLTFRPDVFQLLTEMGNAPQRLTTLCVAQISYYVGCHDGRSQRIQQLRLPPLLEKRVAFKDPVFALTTEGD